MVIRKTKRSEVYLYYVILNLKFILFRIVLFWKWVVPVFFVDLVNRCDLRNVFRYLGLKEKTKERDRDIGKKLIIDY